MRVLVTGGAGFIGSAVVRALSSRSDVEFILIVDSLGYPVFPKNLEALSADPKVEIVTRSVTLTDEMDRLIHSNKITHIAHLAAQTHVDNSISNPMAFVMSNVVGTASVIDAARGNPSVKMMVHVSTDEVYGSIGFGSCSVHHSLHPSSAYSASKAGADLLCLAAFKTYGFPVCITRGANTYGRWQHWEKLIPKCVSRIVSGDPIPVYGKGNQARDWIHVEDHANGIVAAMLRGTPGMTYHLTRGAPEINIDIVRLIISHFKVKGYEPRLMHVTDRPGHDFRYCASPGISAQLLQWNYSKGSIRDELPAVLDQIEEDLKSSGEAAPKQIPST